MAESAAERAAAWGVGLVEPLLPTEARLRADRGLADVALERPEWFRMWAAGVISDLMQTLPAGDAWRDLVAVIPGGPSRGTPGPGVDTSPGGVWLRGGEPFGQARHAEVDVEVATYPGPYDWHLSAPALAEPLPSAAGALLALGLDGRTPVEMALDALARRWAGVGDSAAARLASTVTQAIRWAVFRRRAYLGPADDWALVSVQRWAIWAEGGAEPDVDEVDGPVRAETVLPPI